LPQELKSRQLKPVEQLRQEIFTIILIGRGGVDCLLTEDLQHGQSIEGLQIENPFITA
jgi:predicted nucleic acid-binding protein